MQFEMIKPRMMLLVKSGYIKNVNGIYICKPKGKILVKIIMIEIKLLF